MCREGTVARFFSQSSFHNKRRSIKTALFFLYLLCGFSSFSFSKLKASSSHTSIIVVLFPFFFYDNGSFLAFFFFLLLVLPSFNDVVSSGETLVYLNAVLRET